MGRMRVEPAVWLDAQPRALHRQVELLRRLVDEAQRDPRICVVVVGCSIGRGAADELSDIDAFIAVAAEQWPAYLAETDAMLRHLGDLRDSFQKTIGNGPDAYRLVWALYANGIPLELVVAPAAETIRPKADWIVLYDPLHRIGDVQPPKVASKDDLREWAYEAWSSLLLCAKYLKRRSLWEALETLHLARTRLWRLWAASREIADPQFGLTAVLDTDPPQAPAGIERTHAALDASALTDAALACAELLERVWADAMSRHAGGDASPPPVADAATRALQDVSRT